MAYGQLESVHDPSMGWGGGGLYFHTFTTNVGCMWVKANARSFKLMAQVSDHLSQQQGWDQQVGHLNDAKGTSWTDMAV
ncbi:uncharacterized protein HaLaN_27346 [Haematococcus lacustris]|uniref:Nucleotide-diphospho-sugar transferase domain-containing protein n=1 Tax=Haematococcus lacustris TaxID=44745 RepID=A0A6A0A883_HAELA|nr:uncharacterized protein HaLaN_27346 [Haematococcus lacustris]